MNFILRSRLDQSIMTVSGRNTKIPRHRKEWNMKPPMSQRNWSKDYRGKAYELLSRYFDVATWNWSRERRLIVATIRSRTSFRRNRRCDSRSSETFCCKSWWSCVSVRFLAESTSSSFMISYQMYVSATVVSVNSFRMTTSITSVMESKSLTNLTRYHFPRKAFIEQSSVWELLHTRHGIDITSWILCIKSIAEYFWFSVDQENSDPSSHENMIMRITDTLQEASIRMGFMELRRWDTCVRHWISWSLKEKYIRTEVSVKSL